MWFIRGKVIIYLKEENNRGFTLIELVIAILIAGIVTVSIFQIFRGVVLNWKKAENRIRENYAENNLYILISKKLDELYWYKAIKDYEKYFDGKENSILFISYYSVKIPYFPVFTRIYLDSENNLVMEETPFFFDRPDVELPEPVKMTLWKDVDSIKFSYLVKTNLRREGSFWVDEYTKKLYKPQTLLAVKVKIKLKSGNEITAFSYVKYKEDEQGAPGGLM